MKLIFTLFTILSLLSACGKTSSNDEETKANNQKTNSNDLEAKDNDQEAKPNDENNEIPTNINQNVPTLSPLCKRLSNELQKATEDWGIAKLNLENTNQLLEQAKTSFDKAKIEYDKAVKEFEEAEINNKPNDTYMSAVNNYRRAKINLENFEEDEKIHSKKEKETRSAYKSANYTFKRYCPKFAFEKS
ncbi:MAG: hypothetical protein OXC37_00135 [Bdellovibrionaceae bacterium]|nr:hypothetical protein [Pseudobdellovibrionaceae bacterium]